MKTKKRVLPALIFSLFAATAASPASAQQFSGVVVFGDSLSDAGIYRPFLTQLGLPSSLVATLGRFTTNPGPIWSELVSQHYGVANPAPSNAGGTIYAQGGARVSQDSASTPPGFPQRPVSTQITEYLTTHGGQADPNALYTVWAGANDFLQNFALLQAGQITQAQLQTNVLAAVTSEVQQIARLYQAGARNVMVFINYDPSITPAFASADAATRAGATQLAVGANTTLLTGAASAGLRIIPVDIFSFMAELKANPSAYGFSNTTGIACGPFPPITTSGNAQFCYAGNLVAPNAASTYMFADSIHPTTATHALFAAFAESLIDGPAAYSMLAETPIHTRANHIRTLVDGLQQNEAKPVGGWDVFVAADGGTFDADMAAGKAGSHNKALTIGATARVSDAAMMGIAVGKNRADGSFGGDLGGYGTDELVFSVIGGARWGGLYGNAALSISNLDFRGVHRNIALGPVTRVATADPTGSNASAFFELGYDFQTHGFSIGPTVSVTAQDVSVSSFSESADAGSAALKIDSQRRKSEVWSAGVRASYAMGNWTPWLRVTADKERKDDPRFVTATPLSLIATGNSYDIPAYLADSNYVTTWVGIHGHLDEQIGLSLSYYYVSGRSGVKEDGLSALVSYRF